jgi:hypothetical protein
MCILDESGVLNRAYTENTDPRRCLTIFGSRPFVDSRQPFHDGIAEEYSVFRPSSIVDCFRIAPSASRKQRIMNHSYLSATTGSTRVASRAGT